MDPFLVFSEGAAFSREEIIPSVLSDDVGAFRDATAQVGISHQHRRCQITPRGDI
jgi:hypothetical protein